MSCAADFSCDGGSQCLAPRKLCDQSADCADGSDEGSCEAGSRVCPAGQTPCRDRRLCIHLDWRCDGLADCPDGSDELDCAAHQRRYGELSSETRSSASNRIPEPHVTTLNSDLHPGNPSHVFQPEAASLNSGSHSRP